MRKSLGVIAVFLAVSPLAQAANNFYVGANLVRIEDNGAEAPAIYSRATSLKGGIELSPNFAVEARYAKGHRSGHNHVNGLQVDLELDYAYGVYAKGIMPLGVASPYLLVGYSRGKETATVKAFNFTQSASGKSASYGIGVDVPITKAISFNAEWALLIKGDDFRGVGYKIEGLSAGVAMRF